MGQHSPDYFQRFNEALNEVDGLRYLYGQALKTPLTEYERALIWADLELAAAFHTQVINARRHHSPIPDAPSWRALTLAADAVGAQVDGQPVTVAHLRLREWPKSMGRELTTFGIEALIGEPREHDSPQSTTVDSYEEAQERYLQALEARSMAYREYTKAMAIGHIDAGAHAAADDFLKADRAATEAVRTFTNIAHGGAPPLRSRRATWQDFLWGTAYAGLTYGAATFLPRWVLIGAVIGLLILAATRRMFRVQRP